jgi:hypothetical protein
MERGGLIGLVMAAAFCALMPARAQTPVVPPYLIRADHWSAADERDYDQFIAELGQSDCSTVDDCLHDPHNPYRGSDPPDVVFHSDCADFPYVLRFYFAWKRGLPFSYEGDVNPRGAADDLRYDFMGNSVADRVDLHSGAGNGYDLINQIRAAISSASYRIHPDIEEPYEADHYSAAIRPGAIHPGTIIYDPNGHLATVYAVEPDGRIRYIDAHPDSTVTRGFYDLRFVRAYPGMGAGFQNWRPIQLVGYTRGKDGTLWGGHVVLAANKDISDFSDEQFYGNGPRPADDSGWNGAVFLLKGAPVDYYDFVRAEMAGGTLSFDPLREIADMVDSNCADLRDRVQAVDLALAAGLDRRPEPERLPPNIYGTEGVWEIFSTPSRDARLKTAFKETRDATVRFVTMYRQHDPKLAYRGGNLAADLLAVYERHAGQCTVTYRRSDGSFVTLGYEQARARLFAMSFDPYQCAERRWGATSAEEYAPCPDTTLKTAWYVAEQNLRNQIDRTYEARMDFTLAELHMPGPGKGVPFPPDTDVDGYLAAQMQTAAALQPRQF